MRALVSVYDKSGLVEFAGGLASAGYQLVSSGGTAKFLSSNGLEVVAVEAVTGSPEILDGRVKTLHPRIHGGILARGVGDDAELAAHQIERFDLVVCNLYPFSETLASGAGDGEIIEMIDIGGPAMIRAAAKNHAYVGVVVSPGQYNEVLGAVNNGGLSESLRRRLAAEAFFHTAAYDAAIVEWLGTDRVLPLRHQGELRYGENPHQEASLYRIEQASPWWDRAVFHQGKEMSFNNYVDAEAAWRLASDLGSGCAVIVKHTNPCGVGLADEPSEAFDKAWECDPLSAFGGVVALGGRLDVRTAEAIASKFVEVVIASEVDEEALGVLSVKKALRVLTAPAYRSGPEFRGIEGGFLVQAGDRFGDEDWQVVSARQPAPEELVELRFAWTVAAHTKSNAIVIAGAGQAVGVGAGDQSRVGAAERAVAKAGRRAEGAVAASDAFFPFRDGLDTLAAAGVVAIVEPGGSRNDSEVIAAADEHGIALIFTGSRHFRH